MRYEIKWGYSVKVDKNTQIETLKYYFGDTFSKKCKNEEYSDDNLFEVDVCGKVWVKLNSDEEFLKNNMEIAKRTAHFIKKNMEEYGAKFLYSNILRNKVAETDGFSRENQVLDLSIDRFVKCYKKVAGKIVATDMMFKYDQIGFESTDINPFAYYIYNK